MQKFQLVLIPDEDEDRDPADPLGVTHDAYARLIEAISAAGFTIADGPYPVEEP
jgi:hypothetical protein